MTVLNIIDPAPLSLRQAIRCESPKLTLLKLGICMVLVLNVADAIFTLFWVQAGLGVEANPVLAGLIEQPLLFMIAKLVAVSAGASICWRHLRRPLSAVAVVLANVVYGGIVAYHLGFLFVLLSDLSLRA